MTWKPYAGLVLLLTILAGCALGDAPGATELPPVTLNVPPTLMFAGDCEGTQELNDWLQSMDFLVPEFLNALNSTVGLTREAMRARVIYMARLRDDASKVSTPECAQPIQLLLVEAMNSAVNNFQAYANGDLQDLGNIMAEIIGQLDRVIAAENDLKTRLEEQFQALRES